MIVVGLILLAVWAIFARPLLRKNGLINYIGANPIQMLLADWSEINRYAREAKNRPAKIIANLMNALGVLFLSIYIWKVLL